MNQISILGCGWLGLPLAQSLIRKGFSIKGSTTSDAKISDLEKHGIQPYKVDVGPAKVHGKLQDFLAKSEILIVNFPPKIKTSNYNDFVFKIETLIPYIESAGILKVIFTSSTSVYGDNDAFVNEKSTPNPDTASGKQLLLAEKALQSSNVFQTTVIRFGGLIGSDRHPITSLAGRNEVENPSAPINLIHLDDCIGIIERVIDHGYWGEILNGVAPFHPSREEYYQKKATERNLPLPNFSQKTTHQGKTVLSEKIQEELGYLFKVNPL